MVKTRKVKKSSVGQKAKSKARAKTPSTCLEAVAIIGFLLFVLNTLKRCRGQVRWLCDGTTSSLCTVLLVDIRTLSLMPLLLRYCRCIPRSGRV